MPATANRSSKEWNASALERARQAEAGAARQRELQAQLQDIEARMKETEESVRRNNEQASIERQAGKDQEFYEIGQTNQEDFRNTVADEVFTRIAQTFRTDDDYNYMLAIVENRLGFEDPTEFKAMLWEAIAGNDSAFLRLAAQKTADRYNKPITDEDLDAIKSSVSCLHGRAIISNQNGLARDQIEESDTELHSGEDLPRDQTACAANKESAFTIGGDSRVAAALKPELDSTNAMEKIEGDLMPVRSEAANSDSDVELANPLGPINTVDEELINQINHDNHPMSQGPEPQTPAATRKRPMTDADTPAPAPSETGSLSIPKKRKTNTANANARSTPAFKDIMEERGHVDAGDLLCSKCGEDPKKAKFSRRCNHVYCGGCLTEHLNGLKGKNAQAVLCCHSGCGSSLGVTSTVSASVLKQLREKVVRETNVGEAHAGVGNDHDDEETTEEE